MTSPRDGAAAAASALSAKLDPPILAELAPVLERAVRLHQGVIARFRRSAGTTGVLLRLPFDVVVGRTLATPAGDEPDVGWDVSVRADELLAWIADPSLPAPQVRDAQWRGGRPPESGWHRLDTVPDGVVRELVRSGALTLKDAAVREGVPGAQPRSEVADALLASVVLTVTDEAGARAELSLGTLSAVTRMGFLPRGSHIAVDVAGRWVRVAAEFGSVYVERPGLGRALLKLKP